MKKRAEDAEAENFELRDQISILIGKQKKIEEKAKNKYKFLSDENRMLREMNEALKKNNRDHSVNIQSVQKRIRDLEDSREKDRSQSSPVIGTQYSTSGTVYDPILKRMLHTNDSAKNAIGKINEIEELTQSCLYDSDSDLLEKDQSHSSPVFKHRDSVFKRLDKNSKKTTNESISAGGSTGSSGFFSSSPFASRPQISYADVNPFSTAQNPFTVNAFGGQIGSFNTMTTQANPFGSATVQFGQAVTTTTFQQQSQQVKSEFTKIAMTPQVWSQSNLKNWPNKYPYNPFRSVNPTFR